MAVARFGQDILTGKAILLVDYNILLSDDSILLRDEAYSTD